MGPDDRIGTILAGYRIEELVGRGGMSVVYKAEHIELGRKVALKILLPELAVDDAFRERFVRESRVAAGLEHPNIIPIYEAGEVEGTSFIVMRYVRGTDLGKLLKQSGPLDPVRTVSVIRQTAAALDAAGESGLVHRDIKPANILIVSTGGTEPADHVYLTDFGVTKRIDSTSQVSTIGQMVGTLQYVAPEQIEGKEVDRRADVYSLGCVVYQCLTGQQPFERDSEVSVLWAHMRESPPLVTESRPELPRKVDRVVARAMAKDPEQRYPTAGEMASALSAAIVGVPPAARPRVPKAQPEARPTRRRWAAILLGAAALAVAAAFALTRSDEEQHPVVRPNSVVRIDTASGRISTDIPVAARPTKVAVGEGVVWVVNAAQGTLTRIDPVTNRVEDVITGLPNVTGLAIGFDSLWVLSNQGTLTRRRVDDGTFIGSLSLPPGATGLAVGEGAVWVTTDGADALRRIDPNHNSVGSPIAVGDRGVAVGEGAVWVIDHADSEVHRIEPSDARPSDKVGLLAPPTAVAAGEGWVWVVQATRDLVSMVNPRNGLQVEKSVQVGDGPTAIAVGEGAAWISNAHDGTVSRIDSETFKTKTIRIGRTTDGIAVGLENIWLSALEG